MTEITTIQLQKETRKRLQKFVKLKEETYDSILNKLMDLAEKVNKEIKKMTNKTPLSEKIPEFKFIGLVNVEKHPQPEVHTQSTK